MEFWDQASPQEIESPQESVQSSIIMPRFTYRDSLFASVGIYGGEMSQVTTSHVGSRISLPASNRQLLAEANAFEGIAFAGWRYVLSMLFAFYEYYNAARTMWEYWTDVLVAVLWWGITLVPFLADDVTMCDESIQPKSTNLISRAYYFPRMLANYALSQSLTTVTHPQSRMVIRRALGTITRPEHVGIVLEMNVLAIKQPPEVPAPYLDAEKRLIVPKKRDIARVLGERAEWASAHHVHKASETIRIVYESAKIIAWCACSKVRIVTLYELNGYAWRDMPQLANMVQEEMKNLTTDDYIVNDYIKIVDLDSGKEMMAVDNSIQVSEVDLEQMEPAPEVDSAITVDGEAISTPHTLGSEQNRFSTKLTVLLASGARIGSRSGIKEEIRECIREQFGVSIESDYGVAPRDCVYEYMDPEVIIKFSGPRQQLESLDGFPLVNHNALPLVIEYCNQPASFKGIRRGIERLGGLATG